MLKTFIGQPYVFRYVWSKNNDIIFLEIIQEV